jgi:hypothetical protein
MALQKGNACPESGELTGRICEKRGGMVADGTFAR